MDSIFYKTVLACLRLLTAVATEFRSFLEPGFSTEPTALPGATVSDSDRNGSVRVTASFKLERPSTAPVPLRSNLKTLRGQPYADLEWAACEFCSCPDQLRLNGGWAATAL